MKTMLYYILILILGSCCLGNRKCNQDDNSLRFRILNKTNGDDLVFSATKIFDKNFIAFYSLNGTDTIFHSYGAGPNSNPGQDSLLFVNFDYRKKETVFVRLSNSDTDTLKLIYQIVNASPCCDDYTQAIPNGYNNSNLEKASGGLFLN